MVVLRTFILKLRLQNAPGDKDEVRKVNYMYKPSTRKAFSVRESESTYYACQKLWTFKGPLPAKS